jgi:hypothetical protein
MALTNIKFSNYFEISKPEYIYLKLKPNNSIRNNSTHKLARAIAGLYKSTYENIEKTEEKVIKMLGRNIIIPTKLKINTNSKVSYYIYIEQKKIEFYLIVPKHQLSFIRDKITDVWSNLTIEQVKEIPTFKSDSTKYQIVYKNEDGLSLSVDRRSNELLCSNLNVVEALEDGDKLGLFYNFIPSSQYGWKFKHKSTIDKVKLGKPVERNKSQWSYLLKSTIAIIDNILNTFTGALISSVTENKNDDNTNPLFRLVDALSGGHKVQISSSTNKKGNSIILPTQIMVMGESNDIIRERNITKSLAQSFDTISEDNRLIYKPYRRTFKFTDYSINTNRLSIGDEEAQNFLALAGRDILEQYNFIEKVETFETEVPEDLQTGVMCIGENIYKGKKQKAYLCNDERYRNLLTLIIGPSRSGKSNLISHLCIDAIENDEVCLIFDFIQNCELSAEVARCFPKDKVLEISCDDYEKMQGLGYNEVGFNDDPYKQYVNAKNQTSNMLTLINAINADDSSLSPKMERYLSSASLVVFNALGSIKDVFNVLLDHVARDRFIKKVPSNQYEFLEEYIRYLRELDETDKEGNVIGSKSSLVIGIIDRLNILKRNAQMELMLKKDTKNNINLCEEMQKSQLIIIKMPESAFPTEAEKDICTTYWLTKVWMSLQVRSSQIRDKSKRKKLNIVFDEIYQVKTTEQFMKSKLSQISKFCCKTIISCHYINQLTHMRNELRSANTSYMLISGCDKKNYEELKSELYPFTEDDLKNLKAHYSMNYLKTTDGNSCFITKLPGRVEKRESIR